MNLQRAVEQYFEMIKLGSQALQRLAQHQLYGQQESEFHELMNEIIDRAEKLKVVVSDATGKVNN